MQAVADLSLFSTKNATRVQKHNDQRSRFRDGTNSPMVKKSAEQSPALSSLPVSNATSSAGCLGGVSRWAAYPDFLKASYFSRLSPVGTKNRCNS
jgi:hypothetical protein